MSTLEPIMQKSPLTLEEYYLLQSWKGERFDYYQGEVFSAQGGTAAHSLIAANITGELHCRLKGTTWTVLGSVQRLRIVGPELRCHPDVSVFGTAMDVDPDDPLQQTLINPTVLIDVLWSGTEAYDRGLKSSCYRQIRSLEAYLLVSSTGAHVEGYRRRMDGKWMLSDVQGLGRTLTIPPLDLELPMAEIHAKVDFSAPGE